MRQVVTRTTLIACFSEGDCELVDYKGRTPLHLAAELDRTAAVERLISAPILADVRVHDNMGNRVIASMIRTMPQMVRQ
jgi:hypothetical protein